MNNQKVNVLRIDSSGRSDGSQTRQLVDEFLAQLEGRGEIAQVVSRDVASGVEYVDNDWIAANFTDEADRTDGQKQRLATSDTLVSELEEADLIVLGVPVYNFGVPAALKAWVDQVARARKTFQYTENGPVGLLKNKRAVIIAASGGTDIGSDIDFATPYLIHVLGFLGISDVEVIKASQLMIDADKAIAEARNGIEEFKLQTAA